MRRAALIILVCVSAAACGQKGALYFRDKPPPGEKAPKPDPYKPVPYPKDVQTDADRDRAQDK